MPVWLSLVKYPVRPAGARSSKQASPVQSLFMSQASPLADLQPSALWRHFQMLCDTPRPSKQEAALVQKILSWAEARQLWARLDQAGNVILRKPASAGLENRLGVVLQSHLDMVPQKNHHKDHDFTRDPIVPLRQGDWISADGTTLGADNGIGVAAILAIMESEDIPHGPLEALLTIDEEAGMTGAKGLEPGFLQGQLLFNLDTEDEGELYVGCAGGVDVNVALTPQWQPASGQAWQLLVAGLLGGHSGLDIHTGRANAIQLASRFLNRLTDRMPVALADFQGGSLRNAIPREAQVTLVVPEGQQSGLQAAWDAFCADTRARYGELEQQLELSLTGADLPARALTANQSQQLLSALEACPSHALRMSDKLAGVTETSNNLAVVRFEEDAILVRCLVRSLLDSARDDLARSLCGLFRLTGAEAHTRGAYPGWAPDAGSALLAMMRAVYRQHYGKEPAVKVIHAGLECGLLGAIYPHWDMISFGPTIRGAHSPDERVHIGSVQAFWECLVAGLAAVPARD